MGQTSAEAYESLLQDQNFKVKLSKYQAATQSVQGLIKTLQTYEIARDNSLVHKKSSEINLKIIQADVTLLHRVNHCGLMRVHVEGVQINIKETEECKFFDIKIREVHVLDISNYPRTVNNNLSPYTPSTILRRKPEPASSLAQQPASSPPHMV